MTVYILFTKDTFMENIREILDVFSSLEKTEEVHLMLYDSGIFEKNELGALEIQLDVPNDFGSL